MASRTEEKERRRRERQEAEQAAERAARRKRKLRLVAIGGAVAAVAALIVALALAGGDDPSSAAAKALTADAAAASCTVKTFPAEGREHIDGPGTYKTNPPTSGNHNPTPAPDGIYAPGNEPAKENWVHTLEHGRIIYQYKPGTSAADIAKLRALVSEEFKGSAGYHEVLLQNNTDMPKKFAAVAWTHLMTCDALTPESLKAMRTFREAYVDQAPEQIA
jgi:hypothetical protein